MNHSGILAGALIVGLALPAWADELPSPVPSPSLEQKIDFLDQTFVDQQTSARWWWWGWTSSYFAFMVGNAVVADQDLISEQNHVLWVSCVKSALGFGNMLVARPCTRCAASDTFRALPERTQEEKMLKIKRGEELFQQYAIEGNQRADLSRHASGIGVNIIGSLVLWLYYNDPIQALAGFVSGVAATQLNIWTNPATASDQLNAYNDFSAASPQVRWWISPLPAGLTLNGSF